MISRQSNDMLQEVSLPIKEIVGKTFTYCYYFFFSFSVVFSALSVDGIALCKTIACHIANPFLLFYILLSLIFY